MHFLHRMVVRMIETREKVNSDCSNFNVQSLLDRLVINVSSLSMPHLHRRPKYSWQTLQSAGGCHALRSHPCLQGSGNNTQKKMLIAVTEKDFPPSEKRKPEGWLGDPGSVCLSRDELRWAPWQEERNQVTDWASREFHIICTHHAICLEGK
jgi:hypothetical protein